MFSKQQICIKLKLDEHKNNTNNQYKNKHLD